MDNKLNSIKAICSIHHSEIGGVCDNLDCLSKQQIRCIRCVSDEKSCIRTLKHKSIPLNEYLNKYFKMDLSKFSQDKNYQNPKTPHAVTESIFK